MSNFVDPMRAFGATVRRDPYSFVQKSFTTLNPGTAFEPGWYIEAMVHQLERVYLGENRRLLITIPPRHLKSITASVAFPAWWLGHDPSVRFLVASYGSDLAVKHARDFRTLIETPWYRYAFPHVGRPVRETVDEIVTRRHGGRKAVSLGGAVTGFGANVLIIDDLMKAADATSSVERQRVKDFYEQTLLTRSNDKRDDRVIAIQQRLHEDDLAAFLIQKGNFFHLNLPAIAEEDGIFELGRGRRYERRRGTALSVREPLETLEGLRRDLGEAAFSAQYQQNPVAPGGNLVRWDQIQTYEQAPKRHELLAVFQSWDTAHTSGPNSDYSVCTTWGYHDQSWLLLEVDRFKAEFVELLNRARALRDRWAPDRILIEGGSCGASLHSQMKEDFINSTNPRELFKRGQPILCTPIDSKEVRFACEAAKLIDGRARFPVAAPWLAELKREMLAFPNGSYDDQVDSISQLLNYKNAREPQLGRRSLKRRSMSRR